MKRRNFRIPRRFFSIPVVSTWSPSHEKEKFAGIKKILLFFGHIRLGLKL